LPNAAVPGAVTDLTIAVEGGLVQLSWTPVAGATAYRVESCPAQGGTWTSEGLTVSSFWSTPVDADSSRLFRVISLN
jgi:hypothetical protein